jgi:phage gp16-like protein
MKTRRQRELGRIHILKKELGLNDETYHHMLWAVARVESSADLDAFGRKRVIGHLSARLTPRGKRPPRTLDQRPLLKKIEAQLADAGRPWSYALSLARRIAHKDALELCSDAELGKIVAALAIDAKRRDASRPRARNETRSPRQIEITSKRRVAELHRQRECVYWSTVRRCWIWEPRERPRRKRG